MDRKTFLTTRRIKIAPPESATADNTRFLDCSSYMGAIYYEAFGYEMPHDLTWHMIDYVEPRVFYEFTNEETEEQKAELESEIKKVLQPGDVIVASDDVYGNKSYSYFYTGEGLIGRFEDDRQIRELRGEEIDKYVDSLLGRAVFVILRPTMKNG